MKESGHKHENMQMNEIIWKVINAIKKILIGICKRKRLAGQEAFQKRRPLAEMAFELKLEWQEDGHANIRENSTPDSGVTTSAKAWGGDKCHMFEE